MFACTRASLLCLLAVMCVFAFHVKIPEFSAGDRRAICIESVALRLLLQRVEGSVELLSLLHGWADVGVQRVLKDFYNELQSIAPHSRDVQDCEKCLEKLNSNVNGIMWAHDNDDERAASSEGPRSDSVVLQPHDAPGSPPQIPSAPPPTRHQSDEVAGTPLISLSSPDQRTSQHLDRETAEGPGRAISVAENKGFVELFKVIDATPRKMRRVVNV